MKRRNPPYFHLILLLSFSLFIVNCNKDIQIKEPAVEEEEYQVVEVESDWFSVDYIEDRSYLFYEESSSQGNVSYLLLGNERALMFDTGSGENEEVNGSKIRHLLDQITELPLTLLLSHFHFDHNQNIAEFDHIAFPEIDYLLQSVGTDNIYNFTQEDLVDGNYPPQTEVHEWLPLDSPIDLGGRTVELINLKGHSDESVVIVDDDNQLVFMGDFLYNGPLFLFETEDLIKYEESTDALLARIDSSYRLFGAHDEPEVAYERLVQLKEFLHCINEGMCTGTNTEYWGFPVILYTYEGMAIIIFT